MRRTITLIILLINYHPAGMRWKSVLTRLNRQGVKAPTGVKANTNSAEILWWAVSATFDGTFQIPSPSSSFTGELQAKDIWLFTTEYGRALATGYGTTDRYYLSFGNARVEMYLSTDGRFVVSTKETQAIINELARLSTGGEIGVRISGGKYGNTTYIGSIEAKGFGKEAGNIITTTQAEVEAERQKRIDNNFAFAGTFSISVMGNKMGFYGYLARNKSIGFSIGFFGYEPFQDRKNQH